MRFLLVVMLMLVVNLNCNASTSLQDLEKYLNSIHDLSADFVQINHNQVEQGGKFYLSRPDKMRWDYIYPRKTTLLLNDDQLIYYDYKLDQVSYFKNKEKFLSLLTKKKISFPSSSKIRSNNKQVILEVRGIEDQKEMELFFSLPVIKLEALQIIDENKNKVKIFFNDLSFAVIDPKMFSSHFSSKLHKNRNQQ